MCWQHGSLGAEMGQVSATLQQGGEKDMVSICVDLPQTSHIMLIKMSCEILELCWYFRGGGVQLHLFCCKERNLVPIPPFLLA